jgi:thiamine-phosphate pyrophosphorylase
MKKTERLKGLYIITDRQLSLDLNKPIDKMVRQAIDGGARIIQYRNKQSALTIRRHEAKMLADICRDTGTVFLINDNIELALEVDADGVHLGQNDITLSNARKLLGADKIIGITCHNDLELAQQAEQEGADYVALGRFFPSVTKPTAPPASIETLKAARQSLHIPICAIGGIDAKNGAQLVSAGADMLAVIYAVLGAKSISKAAQQFAPLF